MQHFAVNNMQVSTQQKQQTPNISVSENDHLCLQLRNKMYKVWKISLAAFETKEG